jgi:hypothetical protein
MQLKKLKKQFQMENKRINPITDELANLAPALGKMPRPLPGLVPEGYFQRLSGELIRQGMLSMHVDDSRVMQSTVNEAFADDAIPVDPYFHRMAESLVPAMLLEAEDRNQHHHPTKENRLSAHFIMPQRWMSGIAALFVLAIASVLYVQFQPGNTYPEIPVTLSEDESMVFVEENLDDFTLEELIDSGFIEQEDISLISLPLPSLPSDSL